MSKSGSRSGIDYPSALQDALAWLGAPPADDPLRDLAPLRTHLGGIASVAIPPLQYFKILELFQTRANLTGSTVKPLLLDATLPVAKRLRTVAHGLMDVHEALAAGYSRVIHETTREKLHSLKRTPVQLCALGLANLAQQFEVAQLISAPAPADFWERVQRFHGLIHAAAASRRSPRRMKRCWRWQPSRSFSPRETAFRQPASGRWPSNRRLRTAALPTIIGSMRPKAFRPRRHRAGRRRAVPPCISPAPH
jgi:hypothetical protein